MSGRSFAAADEAATLRILAMPFLDAVSGVDAAAVGALAEALSESRPLFGQILAHPLLAAGISDEHAVRVAALAPVVEDHPELAGVVLDRERTPVDTRLVELPHTGEVTLSVVYVEGGAGGTLDILEELVRAHEAFMRTAFPISHVAVVVADVSPARGGGGPSGILTVDPGSEEDRYLIGHELAHVYWPFYPPWIAEGAAEFMASRVAEFESLFGCRLARTLGALDRLAHENSEFSGDIYRGSGCAYRLGYGLFRNLYDALGDEAFRDGFQRLYLAMRDEAHDAECAGVELGACYVRRAFMSDAPPPGSAALAAPVIDRWYGSPGE